MAGDRVEYVMTRDDIEQMAEDRGLCFDDAGWALIREWVQETLWGFQERVELSAESAIKEYAKPIAASTGHKVEGGGE